MEYLASFAFLIGNSIVAIVECQEQLVGDFPYDIFCDMGIWIFLSQLFWLFQVGSEISSLAVLHNDEYFGWFFVDDSVLVANYVGMLEAFEKIDFSDELLFFSAGHFFKVDFFPDEDGVVGESLDFPDDSEWALADLFERHVFLHALTVNFKYLIKYSNTNNELLSVNIETANKILQL